MTWFRGEFSLLWAQGPQPSFLLEMAQLELGYWAIRGLGAPLRMMLTYAGVPRAPGEETGDRACKMMRGGSRCRASGLRADPALAPPV